MTHEEFIKRISNYNYDLWIERQNAKQFPTSIQANLIRAAIENFCNMIDQITECFEN